MPENSRALLGVNIDHVATVRQARGTRYPDPVQAAIAAEEAGADGITLHLREDRRHIQDRDVHLLRDILQTRMNLEMAVTREMLMFAGDVRPPHCCLVPERREELTTEGGLNVLADESRIKQACDQLAGHGIEVSLFIDPVPAQIEAAHRCGAPVIEIHTGLYADAADEQARAMELVRIREAVVLGSEAGMKVNAGHGLHYHNVEPIAAIGQIHELNIGHAIIARALFTGMGGAVREMRDLLERARFYATGA